MKFQKITFLLVLLTLSNFVKANFYVIFSDNKDTEDKLNFAKNNHEEILFYKTNVGQSGLSTLFTNGSKAFFDEVTVGGPIEFPILSKSLGNSQVTKISSHNDKAGINIEDNYMYLLGYNKDKKQFELIAKSEYAPAKQVQAPVQQAPSQVRPSYQEQAREQIMQAIPAMPEVLANLISQYAEGVDINLALENLNKLKGSQFANIYKYLLRSLISNELLYGIAEAYRKVVDNPKMILGENVYIDWAKTLEITDPAHVMKLLSFEGLYVPKEFWAQYYYLKAFIRQEKNEPSKKLMQELMDIVDENKDKIFAAFKAYIGARRAAFWVGSAPAAASAEDKSADELKESEKNKLMFLLDPFLKILKDFDHDPNLYEEAIGRLDKNLKSLR